MQQTTKHQVYFDDSRNLKSIESESVDLVVTSPPYPMISMWDQIFSEQNPLIAKSLEEADGNLSYQLMHDELNKTWQEVGRVVKVGGIVCINIGDATRTLNGTFKLYPNHSPIIEKFLALGFDALPTILWRKATNAPNKFMGSGMLPVGAYVTLEHERILIFRKHKKREFNGAAERENRMESAFFFTDRNRWFSDVWDDVTGTTQDLNGRTTRNRSGAYPLQIPYRLINMFSVKGDLVLDPFLGTGTTIAASIITTRNSIGIERHESFESIINESVSQSITKAERIIQNRINRYMEFISKREDSGKSCNYKNIHYSFPVVTNYETNICFEVPNPPKKNGSNNWTVSYKPFSYTKTTNRSFCFS